MTLIMKELIKTVFNGGGISIALGITIALIALKFIKKMIGLAIALLSIALILITTGVISL